MEIDQRLSERMLSDASELGPEDLGWNQFVRDHKNYIKQLCRTRTFDKAVMVRYRYRPEEMYVANDGLKQATWIFLLVNDIRDPSEFTEQKCTWLFPPKLKLTELYSIHSGSANAAQ